MATINDLRNKANLIANATRVGENTAERVGGALQDAADLISQLTEAVSTNKNADGLRDEAITALQKVVAELRTALQSESADRRNSDSTLQNLVTAIQGQIDLLVGKNASSAIESFNEVIAFLNGVTDTTKLSGLLSDINNRITAEVQARTEGDAATTGRIAAVESSIVEANSNIGTMQQSITDLQSKNEELKQSIANHKSGNTINVTERWPLSDGYYTLTKAISAVEDKLRVPGAVITYAVSDGSWETRQYVGTDANGWTDEGNWQEFGGGGKLKGIRIDGTTDLQPDSNGVVNINLPQLPTVDTSLVDGSTNPVSGGAVAAKFKEQGATYGAALRLNEIGDGADKRYSLSLLTADGEELSTTDQFSGGGGGTVATTKIVLTKLTANKTVKRGDSVQIAYSYDHVSTDTGASTGNAAHVVMTLSRGTYTISREVDLSAGATRMEDLTEWLDTGTNTVRLRVTVGDGEERQVSTLSWTINVVELLLSSSFNIASVINRGDMVSVPYALAGSGTKNLRCFVDGVETDTRSITASTASGLLTVNTSNMAHGSHSVQLVVELDTGAAIIRSKSIYFDMAVREAGVETPIVATRFDMADGSLVGPGERPKMRVRRYDSYELVYAAYDPLSVPAKVTIYEGEQAVARTAVNFVRTVYKGTVMNDGTLQGRIVVAGTTYSYTVEVTPTDIQVTDPTDGLRLRLSASGRSNSDTNRDEWRYNDVLTSFENMKWGGDGWTGDALRLTGDDRITIGYCPFRQPADGGTGAVTVMMKLKVSDVLREDAVIADCTDADGTGLRITAQEATLKSRGGSVVTTKFAAGEVHDLGFVVWPEATEHSTDEEKRHSGMVYLYINGVMSGGVQRGHGDTVYQTEPQEISVRSGDAAVDLYAVRGYEAALTDGQMLDAYMINLGTAEELVRKYRENDVLDEATGNISPESLPITLPYMIITGQQENGAATLLQAAVTNNKKTKYNVEDILFVNRVIPAMNFRIVGGMIQLQGTSSLAYPTKNYKIFTYGTDKQHDPVYIGCTDNSQW